MNDIVVGEDEARLIGYLEDVFREQSFVDIRKSSGIFEAGKPITVAEKN